MNICIIVNIAYIYVYEYLYAALERTHFNTNDYRRRIEERLKPYGRLQDGS